MAIYQTRRVLLIVLLLVAWIGVATFVGSLTPRSSAGGDWVLLGWQYSQGLVCIDTATGSTTQILASSREFEGMAYDPSANVLYAIENRTLVGPNILAKIDPSTGTITDIGTMTFEEITAMTFDGSTGKIYALDQTTRTLVDVNPLTGAGAPIGNFSSGAANALAAEPGTGQLFAILRIDPTSLAKINKTNGAETLVGSTGAVTSPALAFHPNSGALYTWINQPSGPVGLATLDTTTGAPSIIGGANVEFPALEFVEPEILGPFGGGCGVPASTTPPPLGGVSRDPQVGKLPTATGESSAGRSWLLAVIGAVAIGGIGLGAGVLYVRRR